MERYDTQSGYAPEIEETAERLIREHVLACQSSLVSMLLENGDVEGFEVEEIVNLFPEPAEWDKNDCLAYMVINGIDIPPAEEDEDEEEYTGRLREEISENNEVQEILEWWLVSSWGARELIDIGEPVLDNDHGYWWGRTESGQAILSDGTWEKIALRLHNSI